MSKKIIKAGNFVENEHIKTKVKKNGASYSSPSTFLSFSDLGFYSQDIYVFCVMSDTLNVFDFEIYVKLTMFSSEIFFKVGRAVFE